MSVVKKKFSHIINATLHDFATLTPQEQELLKQAIAVRRNAQAPYSHFAVGVALQSDKGTIHTGCNVERCSWTQTTHAEQNAIDNMVAQWGPCKVTVIAVAGAAVGKELTIASGPIQTSITSANQATLACGHCRQIIWENCYGDPSVKLFSITPFGDVLCTTMGDLLPMPFGPEHLGIDYEKK